MNCFIRGGLYVAMLIVGVFFLLFACIRIVDVKQPTTSWLDHENQCGTVIADSFQLLVINGTSGKRGEVPWHAGIYVKTTKPYKQICGGSLISKDIVISAAHCFWNRFSSKPEPPEKYAVAVGKLYRPWNDTMEQGQRSDVKEIYLPDYFQGSDTHYQDDIAIIVVMEQFKFKTDIRPICVDFDFGFDSTQLQEGQKGKVAGWGLTEENGHASQVLKTLEMPYIDVKTCIDESPAFYRGFITSDKICAGYKDVGIALCQGDSGGGLAFPKSENGLTKYYLRGIVSSAPTGDNACNANFYTSFTWLQKHEHFVNRFWRPKKENCILPPYPEHGTYVTNYPYARPGDGVYFVVLNVSCTPGYRVNGPSFVYCHNGWWPEQVPECIISTSLFAPNAVRPHKPCSPDQFSCRDGGTCISLTQKCDAVFDCPDGSDETHALCWNNKCPADKFRCTYGACVNGTAPCNLIADCPDFSDELLPQCRNKTINRTGEFKCLDGTRMSSSNRCDGWRDCPDRFDETLWSCAAMVCSSDQFQCAYGACVDYKSICNTIPECADGSDEDPDLCETINNDTQTKNCILPSLPTHGTYVTNLPNPRPGDAFDFITINVTCRGGYEVDGPKSVYCYRGWWPEPMPKCELFRCRLRLDPSVEYRCLISGTNEFRTCNEKEPSGTIVRPVCRSSYYSPGVIRDMRCIDAAWDYVARCQPDCGVVNLEYLIGSTRNYSQTIAQVPWHAGIYSKRKQPYIYICGGSLVTTNVVLTAAHCFWSQDGLLPSADFAVAVGKQYKAWDNTMDADDIVQRADINAVHIPVRYQGVEANFQDDIAVVKLNTDITFNNFVKPICIDFDIIFERRQLTAGNIGVMSGYNLANRMENSTSQSLMVEKLPYVEVTTCIQNIPTDFRTFITSDKICAGSQFSGAGTSVCLSDSGAGLVFPERDRRYPRYYLRGVASVTSTDSSGGIRSCPFFTQVTRHEHFIKSFL